MNYEQVLSIEPKNSLNSCSLHCRIQLVQGAPQGLSHYVFHNAHARVCCVIFNYLTEIQVLCQCALRRGNNFNEKLGYFRLQYLNFKENSLKLLPQWNGHPRNAEIFVSGPN